jgi:hypothetical protein
MNNAQLKCLSVFALFAIIGFGPVSPGCLIGLYIVIMRPNWFLQLTDNLYSNQIMPSFIVTNNIRTKAFICLLILFVIDIAPVPVTPAIAFIIIFIRPLWFHRIIIGVYNDMG